MPWSTVLPLLLGLTGVAALTLGRRRVGGPSRFAIGARLRPAQRITGPARFRPLPGGRIIGPGRFRPLGSNLLGTFGRGTSAEYPAPYRFADARELAAILLRAASETSPKLSPFFKHLVVTQRATKRTYPTGARRTRRSWL